MSESSETQRVINILCHGKIWCVGCQERKDCDDICNSCHDFCHNCCECIPMEKEDLPRPECPWCSYEYDTEDLFSSSLHDIDHSTEGTYKAKCPSCGKTFKVTLEFVFRYDSKPIAKEE